jgi:hypothetical protein
VPWFERPPQDYPEQFNGGHHGLLSSEMSNAAVTEGFAHFVAAIAFNDPGEAEGSFTYYKEIGHLSWPTLAAAENAVSLGDDSVGAVDAWVETQCGPPADPNDFDWPYETVTDPELEPFEGRHISSEIDWLRVFWRFVADDTGTYGTEQATVPDVFDVIVTAADPMGLNYSPDPFTALSSAASSELPSALATRFDDISADLGVYNDGP